MSRINREAQAAWIEKERAGAMFDTVESAKYALGSLIVEGHLFQAKIQSRGPSITPPPKKASPASGKQVILDTKMVRTVLRDIDLLLADKQYSTGAMMVHTKGELSKLHLWRCS
jgi:hypothetical protein